MNKIIGLTAFFSLQILVSIGQIKSERVSVLWGKEQKESRRSTLDDIAGHDKSGIYVLKTGSKVSYVKSSITLEHYDNLMNQSKSVELILREGNKESHFEHMIHFNNQLYVFSSFKDQKLKKNLLFVQSVDKKTLRFNPDKKQIAQIDYSGKRKKKRGKFQL